MWLTFIRLLIIYLLDVQLKLGLLFQLIQASIVTVGLDFSN